MASYGYPPPKRPPNTTQRPVNDPPPINPQYPQQQVYTQPQSQQTTDSRSRRQSYGVQPQPVEIRRQLSDAAQRPATGSYQHQPSDTLRPSDSQRRPRDSERPTASSNAQWQPPHDMQRPPVDGSRRPRDTEGPIRDTVSSHPLPVDEPRRPREAERPTRYAGDSSTQWQPPNDTQRLPGDSQRRPRDTERPTRDFVDGSGQQPSYITQQQPVNIQRPPVDNQRLPGDRQRQPLVTADIGHRRQPSDPQWQSNNIQRQPHELATSSHRQQTYDSPLHPDDPQRQTHDTIPDIHRRQSYNAQREPVSNQLHGHVGSSIASSSSSGPRLPRHDTAPVTFPVPMQHHPPVQTSSHSQGEPHGVDLTGRVRILTYPGQKYLWAIGNGAFTDVYKGEYKMSPPGIVDDKPTLVAVKIFRASTGMDTQKMAAVSRRLVRESNVWLRLKHPNIQPYLGHCSDLGLSIALISPLCDNSTVTRYITDNPSCNRLKLIKDVADGLKYLHSKDVIHADLQCNNVLVDKTERAILIDFGRSKVIGEQGFSTALLAGSAAYMAPELFPTGEVNIDALFSKKSDVYAFGMLCLEVCTNEVPFACYNARLDWQIVPLVQQGRRPRLSTQLQRCISEDMCRLMEACWVTRPEDRPDVELIVKRIK